MKKSILTTICLFFMTSAYADPDLQNFVDTYLSQNQSDEYFSTAAMTLQCKDLNGKIFSASAYSGSLGFGDNPIEQKKTSEEDVFQIGSITKSFISVVLLQLEDDPKYNFNIDDPVGKWFPEDKYQNWKDVKVRQLLNMTSGIPNYDSLFIKDIQSNPYHYFSLEDILKYESLKPLEFLPGTKYEYSNTNYTLAGLLIERITHHSVEIEVTQRIIDKLKLKHSFFPKNLATDEYPYDKLVHGYHMRDTFLQKTDITNFSLSWANSAGAIISNTNDINTYVQALFTPGQILSASQIEKLKTSEPGIIVNDGDLFTIYYGLGIGKLHDKKMNEDSYEYQGSTFGFMFTYWYFPARSLNVVLTYNSAVTDDNEQSAGFIYNTIVPKIFKTKCNW